MTRTRVTFGLASLAVLTSAACGNSKDPALIVASGHVEATDVRISAKVGGRLQSFAIQEGDTVTPGQELARIDTTDLRLTLAQLKAERGQAEAELKLRWRGPGRDIAELQAQMANLEAELEGPARSGPHAGPAGQGLRHLEGPRRRQDPAGHDGRPPPSHAAGSPA
jgi:HlyD family secretion protein